MAAFESLDVQAPQRSPILVRMSDVEPEEVQWFWQPYIPSGKVTLLEADPGIGKTWLALALCAAASKGLPLPGQDGVPIGEREPSPALYLTAEDGLGDTLRPRLDRAGADLQRVTVLDGVEAENGERQEVTLADLDVLEEALSTVRPSLMVVDPIQGYLGARVDVNRANEVRPLLAGLARLAERHSCAIVAIRHLRKSASDRAVHRGLGSIDFSAAVRSILLVGEDPENERRKIIAHSKSNLAQAGSSIAFEICDGEFCWAGTSELSAGDLLCASEREQSRPRSAAVDFLETTLANGPVAVPALKKEAKEAGCAWRTVERAKDELGVKARKRGFSGGWEWSLPRRPPTFPSRENGGVGGETAGEDVGAQSDEPGGGLPEELPF